ncbi:unnamed protein product [Blepharisma stoltei]|uniref:Uncharacterized protein n=1 Tax=Blepharisma stoltei TaxID=1481888 RepID=A0AAU9K6J9_9CILI|nr:unnamed protein product [Blepharisma stoltei]
MDTSLEAQHRALHAKVQDKIASISGCGQIYTIPPYYFLPEDEIKEINTPQESEDAMIKLFIKNILHNENNDLPPFLQELSSLNPEELLSKLLEFYTKYKIPCHNFKKIRNFYRKP